MDQYIFPELYGDKQTEEPIAECCICRSELYTGEVVYRTLTDELVCPDCLEEWAKNELKYVSLEEEV